MPNPDLKGEEDTASEEAVHGEANADQTGFDPVSEGRKMGKANAKTMDTMSEEDIRGVQEADAEGFDPKAAGRQTSATIPMDASL